ncbi:hypothetical protein O1W68_19550 [Rhodococcus sp. H36-A4]|uniref:T3SS (YopN, CesT) and YbjN peptide-binding chaperone 1 n=1 Tax=Rhodococcus sp. H36-A4 TaxID=3004353 RepID=UPI0022AFF8DD|nr:hypothetical protein [Rhodococcus sp. H36-A4]MCZ4080144.1 hypothetical protein [Rhodococcus sp. H36-A4]
MSEELDFDAGLDAAWIRFTVRLGCYFAAMRCGDTLSICTTTTRERLSDDDLSLTVTGRFDGAVRVDVTLRRAIVRAMTAEDRIMLAHAGWDGADSGSPSAHHSLDLYVLAAADDTEFASAAITTLLREIHGVTHPSFLAAWADGSPPSAVFDTDSALEGWDAPTPHDRLSSQVDAILDSIMFAEPSKDADGDIAFPFDCGTAYLRVLETEPVVELFIAFDVDPQCRAATSITTDLALSWPDINFRFPGDTVVATTRIDCSPLVEEHLGRGLGMFVRFISECGDALAAQLQQPSIEEEILPAELRSLIYSDLPGLMPDPRHVASVCEHDRLVILEFLRVCAREHLCIAELADHAIAEGKDDTLLRRNTEIWRRAEESMRAALRFVVDGPGHRTIGSGRQTRSFPGHSRSHDDSKRD